MPEIDIEQLQKIIENRHETYEEFYAVSGISKASLSRWRKTKTIQDEMLERLCVHFQFPPTAFSPDFRDIDAELAIELLEAIYEAANEAGLVMPKETTVYWLHKLYRDHDRTKPADIIEFKEALKMASAIATNQKDTRG